MVLPYRRATDTQHKVNNYEVITVKYTTKLCLAIICRTIALTQYSSKEPLEFPVAFKTFCTSVGFKTSIQYRLG